MTHCQIIIGTDEAGRGPLAGPVVGAAVILPAGYCNEEIRDSKKLSSAQRDNLYDHIVTSALAWSAVSVGHRRIDSINILQAALLAMRLAVTRCYRQLSGRGDYSPERFHVLIDGNKNIGSGFREDAIIGGDDKVIEISAASILAKVTRDRIMDNLHRRIPCYEFNKHAGYATKLHMEKLASNGPCFIHRKTFGPVREILEKFSAGQTGRSAGPISPT